MKKSVKIDVTPSHKEALPVASRCMCKGEVTYQVCGDYCRVTTPARQRELIIYAYREFEKYNKNKRQAQVYIVSSTWWRKWASFVDYVDECTLYRTLPDNTEEDSDVPLQPSLSYSQDCTSPGPIDNTDILKQGTNVLRNKLKELKDFVLVPISAWTYLQAWYGLESESTSALLRYIYSDPLRTPNQFFLDLYPEKRLKSPIRIKTFTYQTPVGKKPASNSNRAVVQPMRKFVI